MIEEENNIDKKRVAVEEKEEPSKQKGLDAASKLGFHFTALKDGTGCKLQGLFSKSIMERYHNLKAGDSLAFINDIKVIREKFDITMMEFSAAALKLPMTLTFRQTMKV